MKLKDKKDDIINDIVTIRIEISKLSNGNNEDKLWKIIRMLNNLQDKIDGI